MLHHRSVKSSHLNTILYEIDMLRHCSKTVAAKRAARSKSEDAGPEYYLHIEGFLIHLRNLIAFFTTEHSPPPDLVLSDPKVWLGRDVDEKEYTDLRNEMKSFNNSHGETLNGKKVDCYGLISKFLQHCTPMRYEHAMGWDIEKMSAELEPVLAAFTKRFASPRQTVAVLHRSSHSTR